MSIAGIDTEELLVMIEERIESTQNHFDNEIKSIEQCHKQMAEDIFQAEIKYSLVEEIFKDEIKFNEIIIHLEQQNVATKNLLNKICIAYRTRCLDLISKSFLDRINESMLKFSHSNHSELNFFIQFLTEYIEICQEFKNNPLDKELFERKIEELARKNSIQMRTKIDTLQSQLDEAKNRLIETKSTLARMIVKRKEAKVIKVSEEKLKLLRKNKSKLEKELIKSKEKLLKLEKDHQKQLDRLQNEFDAIVNSVRQQIEQNIELMENETIRSKLAKFNIKIGRNFINLTSTRMSQPNPNKYEIT
ncbi:hypothetical protein QR98_0003660 [Sarcoptes scabiei]|uniref:Uncharacterized protein n=1 Tax=Sarcoptes scabiei TaxID=52283 RepID=A0A131ZT62_SARSC|nr:hypothetical protein QR98_0003660 [Sarcoptes scabiei]